MRQRCHGSSPPGSWHQFGEPTPNVTSAALRHGRGTVNGTVAEHLRYYIGRVFLCLTGDRDNRPNAGEERSILGNHNRSNARIARVGELLRSAWVPN